MSEAEKALRAAKTALQGLFEERRRVSQVDGGEWNDGACYGVKWALEELDRVIEAEIPAPTPQRVPKNDAWER